jgi:uncharacterized protein YegL
MATNWGDLLAKAMEEDVATAVVPATIDPQLPHVPIVLLIDTSSSMEGAKIAAVNTHLAKFFDDIANGTSDANKTIRQYGDFSVVRYGNGRVDVEVPWTHGSQLSVTKPMTTAGDTPMGAAIIKAGELLLDRFRAYNRDRTVDVMCGAVFNLTDGAPTDMAPDGIGYDGKFNQALQDKWTEARSAIEVFEFAGSSGHSYVQFFQVGAPGYDAKTLEALSARQNRVFEIGKDMSEFFDFVKLSLTGLGQYPTIADAIQARIKGAKS